MPFPPIRIPIVSVEDHDSSLAQSGLFPFFGAFPSLHSTGWTALPYWHVTAICDATLSVFLLAPSLCSVPSSPPVFVPKRGISQRSAQKVQRDNRRPVYQPCSVRVSERAFCAGSFFWPFLRKKRSYCAFNLFYPTTISPSLFLPFPKNTTQHCVPIPMPITECAWRSGNGNCSSVSFFVFCFAFTCHLLYFVLYVAFVLRICTTYSAPRKELLHTKQHVNPDLCKEEEPALDAPADGSTLFLPFPVPLLSCGCFRFQLELSTIIKKKYGQGPLKNRRDHHRKVTARQTDLPHFKRPVEPSSIPSQRLEHQL